MFPEHSAAPTVHIPQKKIATAQQLSVKVSREGEHVKVVIGNVTLPLMPYEAAMRIGQWMLAKGAEAKFMAGDAKKRVITS